MDRVVRKREFANKWVDDLGPKIHKKIEKIKNRYGDYIIYPCGEGKFEAGGVHGGQHTINLQQQSCSYRRWDLTGIPCEHAAWVIDESSGELEEYVSDWYSKLSYLTSYGNIMHPMNGPIMWEKSGKAPIKLGEFVKQLERPQSVAKKATTTGLANPLGLQIPFHGPIPTQKEEDKKGDKEEEEDKEGDNESITKANRKQSIAATGHPKLSISGVNQNRSTKKPDLDGQNRPNPARIC
ncbi:hypothetical protein Vadar_029192 [Vaccinium darrowii]|uniref:Uncharacterized protein n=1 Tax=Vaccinium darrowii TaxID=229202 RepID=A0ACB7YB72_9ERIC|nr:hypothetical protein Vadar_029192 [Vaccinium darrowii]